MASGLEVNTDGLRTASGASDIVASALKVGTAVGASGSHASYAGVGTFDAAIGALRDRQSVRISSQADDLSVSSARYEHVDGDAADDITGTV